MGAGRGHGVTGQAGPRRVWSLVAFGGHSRVGVRPCPRQRLTRTPTRIPPVSPIRHIQPPSWGPQAWPAGGGSPAWPCENRGSSPGPHGHRRSPPNPGQASGWLLRPFLHRRGWQTRDLRHPRAHLDTTDYQVPRGRGHRRSGAVGTGRGQAWVPEQASAGLARDECMLRAGEAWVQRLALPKMATGCGVPNRGPDAGLLPSVGSEHHLRTLRFGVCLFPGLGAALPTPETQWSHSAVPRPMSQ